MNKWNFDVIFEGTIKEQICKVGHFKEGLKALARDASKSYAMSVLNWRNAHAEDALSTLHDYEEAEQSLINDPRFQRVVEAAVAEEQSQTVESLRKAIYEATERAFGPRRAEAQEAKPKYGKDS